MNECFLYSLVTREETVLYAVNYDDHDEIWELRDGVWKRSTFAADELPIMAKYQGLSASPVPHGAVGRIGKAE